MKFGSYKTKIESDMYEYDELAEIEVVVYGWQADENIILKVVQLLL